VRLPSRPGNASDAALAGLRSASHKGSRILTIRSTVDCADLYQQARSSGATSPRGRKIRMTRTTRKAGSPDEQGIDLLFIPVPEGN